MADVDAPYIGIDLGGTHFGVGVISSENRLLHSERAKTAPEQGAASVLKRIAEMVERVTTKSGLSRSDIGGVGIGAPGAIDYERGVVLNAPNLRWRDFALAERLSELVGLPVVVDNDVNVGTWGEFKMGAGAGYENLMGIFVGTGVGGGLVLHGQLYRGGFHTAGEIGHMVVQADAPLGRRTLENLAGRTSMIHQLTQLVLANHPTSLAVLNERRFEAVQSRDLAEAVASGDELVLEVVDAAARYVGVAIANTVTLLSLSAVVVGGGITESLGEAWLGRVRASFEKHVFPAELRACKLVAAQLEGGAGTMGAALLAREGLCEKVETS